MSFDKPFHRNYRPIKQGENSGYSDWAYIVDKGYAQKPEYYTRAFSIIQEDILKLFEYVEPSDTNTKTYSFRIHELLMRTCIEVETNFKAILRENIFTPIYKHGSKKGRLRSENEWNINDFSIVNKTHHLDSYSVKLPFWKGAKNIRHPFKEWKSKNSLSWYQAYNQAKHDRINNFENANLENLLDAYSGLFVLLSSQFRTESFSTGGYSLGGNSNSYYDGSFGIGGFLMITFPENWNEKEIYEFDWSILAKEKIRFRKIDYDNI